MDVIELLLARIERQEARIAHLEGPDGEAFGRVLNNVDVWLRIAGVADADELRRFLDGTLGIMVILEHEFERRFPAEHAAWAKTVGE
jgi:hypothetical protein